MMDIIDNIGSFKLTSATLPVLIKMIYDYLVNKYNLFAVEQRPQFETMFLASLNLAMRVPFKKIKKSFLRLFKWC
jgi:hypothetical protein